MSCRIFYKVINVRVKKRLNIVNRYLIKVWQEEKTRLDFFYVNNQALNLIN